jgi:hypothetical protein
MRPMSDEDRDENAWVATYVDPYRGVERPESFHHWTVAGQRAWELGVDAALALHSDVIERCNRALQQATGGRS